ncbi:hypothetical protein BT102_12505 [Lacticaseibacillus rhamnosus]|nr:hypothetical protein BT102_12505 [Lacticaseibacillus rhamnosus]
MKDNEFEFGGLWRGSVGVIGASGRTFYNALVVAEVCACKGLNRNDQDKRRLAEDMLLGQLACLAVLSITRSQSQKSECKDLKRNGQEVGGLRRTCY